MSPRSAPLLLASASSVILALGFMAAGYMLLSDSHLGVPFAMLAVGVSVGLAALLLAIAWLVAVRQTWREAAPPPG